MYFIQTISFTYGDTFCKVMALLGIFFPVASFLWTDFIAFYLYIAVTRRSLKKIFEWKNLLRIFHFTAWTTSAVIIIVVASFGHEGKSDEALGDDDVVYGNTGAHLI